MSPPTTQKDCSQDPSPASRRSEEDDIATIPRPPTHSAPGHVHAPQFTAGALFVLGLFLQAQRPRIDAVAQAGGIGAIFEHVTEVRITPAAFHFRADHAVAGIAFRRNTVIVDGRPEARPARAGMELCFRPK